MPTGGGENPAAVALSQAVMPSRVQGDGIGRERVESPSIAPMFRPSRPGVLAGWVFASTRR